MIAQTLNLKTKLWEPCVVTNIIQAITLLLIKHQYLTIVEFLVQNMLIYFIGNKENNIIEIGNKLITFLENQQLSGNVGKIIIIEMTVLVFCASFSLESHYFQQQLKGNCEIKDDLNE